MINRCVVLALCATAAACSGGDDGPSQPGNGPTTFTVSVENNRFTPSSLSVPLNSTVTWQWNSSGVEHNVSFQGGPASANMTSGSFPRVFSTAGTFSYVCTIHAAEGMTGTVTVAGTAGGDGDGGGGGDAYP
jgi:plastocyanin